MHKFIQDLKKKVGTYVITDQTALQTFKKDFLGQEGAITNLFKKFKTLELTQKKNFGKPLNELKKLAEEKFKLAAKTISSTKGPRQSSQLDLTLPSLLQTGSLHPLTSLGNQIVSIMKHIHFQFIEAPEIESDEYNFTALNFPDNHPARDMQDTFFVENKFRKGYLLRTHTSNMQIHTMQKQKPPIRVMTIGRVYRNEAISVRTHCMFHQVEALYVNHKVSLTELQSTLQYLIKALFGQNVTVRFRGSYFPFTEPSIEIDISCIFCAKKGCKFCKHTSWIEIGGGGMVDPNVLENCNLSSEEYTGFALGMGLERIAMLFYTIDDIRLFTENDLQFLIQF